MTTLYIVRHAFAGHHGDPGYPGYPDDSQRPLTPKGIKQFSKLVKRLAGGGLAPQTVVTSPYVRCRQTAELLCEGVDPSPELVELEALEPGSELEALIDWSNRQDADSLAWVGHSPDVEHLAAALVSMRAGNISFSKGAVAAIRFDDEIAIGAGELRWFVSPKVLG
ncbi:MAG: hypothetical protein DWQ37_21890 [Planctomycetota bacterium]|nr:MAG: hypothetical protein DWQ37_21890 [Planctomycetota bacterium]